MYRESSKKTRSHLKKLFWPNPPIGGQVFVLDPRFNPSEYYSMCVEDTVRRGGLNIGPPFYPAEF